MWVWRFFGRLLIVLGLVVFGLGGWLWLAGEDVTQPAGHIGADLAAPALDAVRDRLPDWLWRPVALLLAKPLWEAVSILCILLFVLGGVLVGLARRRDRRRPYR